MVGFTLVWIGQIVSVLASAMSQFGLTIFVFQKTESAFRSRFDAGLLYHSIPDHLSDCRRDGGSPQPQNDDDQRPYTCVANLNISIPK